MTAYRTRAIRTAAAWMGQSPIRFRSQWNFWHGRSMRRCCSRSPRPTRRARLIAERRRDSVRSPASRRDTLARSRRGVESMPRLLDGRAIFARPQTELADRLEQGVAEPGEFIFDARRNGRIDRACE